MGFILYIQGNIESKKALSCSLFLAKESIITGLFCGKWPTKIRHSRGLRHVYIQGNNSRRRDLFVRVTWLICMYCIHIYMYIYSLCMSSSKSHSTNKSLLRLCIPLNVHTAKTPRMPYLCRSFSAKEPYNYWLFCEK